MKRVFVGLLTLAAVLAALWNLGWLWRLLDLPPHDPPVPNEWLGLAVAIGFLFAGLSGSCTVMVVGIGSGPWSSGSRRSPTSPALFGIRRHFCGPIEGLGPLW